MAEHEDINAFLKKCSPLMEEGSEIFRELAAFFGTDAKIETDRADLRKFLGHRRLYRILRIAGSSFKDCAYQLIDDHPEALEALGMLRYYRPPAGAIRWEEIEAAEIAMGKELTMSTYGWMPDAWTAFDARNDGNDQYTLVALLAVSFED